MASSSKIEKDREFWNLVAKYRRGVRDEMLEYIGDTARNSTEISEVTGISTNSAGNYLSEAEKEGITKAVTPDAEKYKMYVLTEKGQKVLEEL
jgi:predicted transcriptional regulator